MDYFIKRFDASKDADLRLCPERGIAYQRDMRAKRVPYNGAYFDHYAKIEGAPIALTLNAGRRALVDKYVGPDTGVLDVGVGSGEFVKTRPNTYGYDVNKAAEAWLKERNRWSAEFGVFEAFTFWDVIEHVEDPNGYFKQIRNGVHLFTSLPIFKDLGKVRESKHYKPGEHLYYFTEQGFIDWMALYRFRCLEVSDFETRAGRESILSFAFKRSLPGYRDTIAQYAEIHSKAYGITARMYLDMIGEHVMRLDPRSILDFGCGRSDLAAHFWKDGKRRIERYDPAIPDYKEMPEGEFDLVICCDVMEHIPMASVERVFAEIKAKSGKVIFTISLRPARQKLPDGRNAHVTLLTAKEWKRWVTDYFGVAEQVPTGHDHLLMLKTWA